jgi:hypothetical protein
MQTIKATFHHDAGHGWLKVSIPDFIKTKCFQHCQISRCSYFDKNFVYLEEDWDATQFENAAKLNGFEVDHSAQVYDGDQSPIRNKWSFRLSDIFHEGRELCG